MLYAHTTGLRWCKCSSPPLHQSLLMKDTYKGKNGGLIFSVESLFQDSALHYALSPEAGDSAGKE